MAAQHDPTGTKGEIFVRRNSRIHQWFFVFLAGLFLALIPPVFAETEESKNEEIEEAESPTKKAKDAGDAEENHWVPDPVMPSPDPAPPEGERKRVNRVSFV